MCTVQVRLILTLTPVVCVLSAIALSRVFEIFLHDDTPAAGSKAAGAKAGTVGAASDESADAAAADAGTDAKVRALPLGNLTQA